jgi:CBS domain-containing protein/anti-sigma regulatory factor (Ser/Thr protein kinase)
VERSRTDVSKVQELVYELKIQQVMVRDVITCSPDLTMSDLRALLRLKRISGVPVTLGRTLVGMISVDNLLRALERGEMSATVGEKMTRQLVSVRPEETVVSAIILFARYGYGRFPVVGADGNLVGIVTKGDIVRGLLKQMELLWQAEETRRHQYRHIFEDIESDETALILRYAVKKHDFVHGGQASGKIKRALERLGAHPQIMRRIAVATYEAEVNIMIHSYGGEIIAEARPDQMTVTAQDTGPGIEDIDQVMQPGFSTAPDWIRELGFGAGMGLYNIRNCTDEMRLTSEVGVGTKLVMVFKIPVVAKGGS